MNKKLFFILLLIILVGCTVVEVPINREASDNLDTEVAIHFLELESEGKRFPQDYKACKYLNDKAVLWSSMGGSAKQISYGAVKPLIYDYEGSNKMALFLNKVGFPGARCGVWLGTDQKELEKVMTALSSLGVSKKVERWSYSP